MVSVGAITQEGAVSLHAPLPVELGVLLAADELLELLVAELADETVEVALETEELPDEVTSEPPPHPTSPSALSVPSA